MKLFIFVDRICSMRKIFANNDKAFIISDSLCRYRANIKKGTIMNIHRLLKQSSTKQAMMTMTIFIAISKIVNTGSGYHIATTEHMMIATKNVWKIKLTMYLSNLLRLLNIGFSKINLLSKNVSNDSW